MSELTVPEEMVQVVNDLRRKLALAASLQDEHTFVDVLTGLPEGLTAAMVLRTGLDPDALPEGCAPRAWRSFAEHLVLEGGADLFKRVLTELKLRGAGEVDYTDFLYTALHGLDPWCVGRTMSVLPLQVAAVRNDDPRLLEAAVELGEFAQDIPELLERRVSISTKDNFRGLGVSDHFNYVTPHLGCLLVLAEARSPANDDRRLQMLSIFIKQRAPIGGDRPRLSNAAVHALLRTAHGKEKIESIKRALRLYAAAGDLDINGPCGFIAPEINPATGERSDKTYAPLMPPLAVAMDEGYMRFYAELLDMGANLESALRAICNRAAADFGELRGAKGSEILALEWSENDCIELLESHMRARGATEGEKAEVRAALMRKSMTSAHGPAPTTAPVALGPRRGQL